MSTSGNSVRAGAPIITDRLVLRPARLAARDRSDVPALFAFLGDPEVMRHTDCLPTLQACRRHIVGHEWQRRRLGFAPWTVLDRADGRIIGWGGCFDDPFDRGWGPEIGYWFSRHVWGRGYATELVGAALGFARATLQWPSAQAFVKPGNAASQRVLEKSGFSVDRFIPALDRVRLIRPL